MNWVRRLQYGSELEKGLSASMENIAFNTFLIIYATLVSSRIVCLETISGWHGVTFTLHHMLYSAYGHLPIVLVWRMNL